MALRPGEPFGRYRVRAVPRTAIEEARVDVMEAFVAAKVGDPKRRLSTASEAKRKPFALSRDSKNASMGVRT